MDDHADVDLARASVRAVADDVAGTLVGHDWLVERLLIAYLTGGHVLLEGPPGIASCLTARVCRGNMRASSAPLTCCRRT